MDSGIVVSRAAKVEFWHLTFQEHLAARAIAGLPDTDQQRLLLSGAAVYQPEWRAVVLLYTGLLASKQGLDKVDALFLRGARCCRPGPERTGTLRGFAGCDSGKLATARLRHRTTGFRS